MAVFEWFTGEADRSKKARENIGIRGSLVDEWKYVNMKVPRKLEKCNFQNRNFNSEQISSVPVQTGNNRQSDDGGQSL